MYELGWLTRRFEQDRARLHALAYRMLGSPNEAEDAVQEAWLRLHRIDPGEVENLSAWLTTVVSRVCLDMLRSRKARREEPIGPQVAEPIMATGGELNPEAEVVLADSVGVALLVVLDTLTPPERLAFVLHDLFAMPFDEIATILGRSQAASKQLASRARRRVRAAPAKSSADRARQRELVEAFLRAVRTGDVEGLLAVLDPDAVLRIDGATRMAGGGRDAADTVREVTGASMWAMQMIAMSRRFQSVPSVEAALIDGAVGLIFAPRGKLSRALIFTCDNAKVTRVEVIGDPVRLRELAIAVL
jgi:RNA polymerase sigma-70 factor (ECF subfamily)